MWQQSYEKADIPLEFYDNGITTRINELKQWLKVAARTSFKKSENGTKLTDMPIRYIKHRSLLDYIFIPSNIKHFLTHQKYIDFDENYDDNVENYKFQDYNIVNEIEYETGGLRTLCQISQDTNNRQKFLITFDATDQIREWLNVLKNEHSVINSNGCMDGETEKLTEESEITAHKGFYETFANGEMKATSSEIFISKEQADIDTDVHTDVHTDTQEFDAMMKDTTTKGKIKIKDSLTSPKYNILQVNKMVREREVEQVRDT